jgi:hypothetical protein
VTWRTQRRHAVSGAGVDYSTLIARRKAVVALVKAGVGAAADAAPRELTGAQIAVSHGATYYAKIQLTGMESMFGSASAVKGKLEGAGFTSVVVYDDVTKVPPIFPDRGKYSDGSTYWASGVYSGPATTKAMPSEVKRVWVVDAPAAPAAALPAAAAAPSLDTAPAPGKERAWFDALKAEASAQLDTIAGWIKTGTAAAKAKAKAALEAMRPTLEELDKVAKLALLANPMTMPGYVTADLTTRTADMVDELGGVKTVGNIALILAALWAWHKWG